MRTHASDPTKAYPNLVYEKQEFFGPNKFGLGRAIDQTGRKHIRNAGTAYWCRLANTFYSIDRKIGKAVMFFCNTLPCYNK